MRIDILTLFPGMFEGPFSQSIIKRAINKGLVSIHLHDIRDFAFNKHRTVDDYPYGGGAGMVMMAEPIAACLDALLCVRAYDEVIFLTPDGELLAQGTANHLSTRENIILLCGHYKGIDQRIRELYITRELSIGNYVLSGGELPAMVVCDTLIRLIPGVLNDETSALSDSFQNQMLSAPVYTRPALFRGMKVPDVLLSGNDKEINAWKEEISLQRTRERRPDIADDKDFDSF